MYTVKIKLVLPVKETIGYHKNVLDHKLEVLNHQYSYKALVTNPYDNLKNALRLSALARFEVRSVRIQV